MFRTILGATFALAVASGGAFANGDDCFDKGSLNYGDCGYSWTGFSLGLFAGGGTGTFEQTEIVDPVGFLTPPFRDDTFEGALAGAELGYDHDFEDFVLGVAADFALTDLDGFDYNDPGDDGYATNFDWLATIRARAGVPVDRFLVYATGGVAFASLEATQGDLTGLTFNPATGVATYDDVVTGYTVGAGLAYALNDLIVLGAEYQYLNFEEDLTSETSTGGPGQFEFSEELHTGRASIKVRF